MNNKEREIIRCPLCGYQGIETKPGKSICPECSAAFEIDDRREWVFVGPDNLRLPIEGNICMRCSLLQEEETENCANCEGRLYNRLQ